MLADSEPKEECYHSLNWVMAHKAKKLNGGSEMGKQPMCQGEGTMSTTLMQNAPTYREAPTSILEGWLRPFKAAKQK